MSSRRRLALLVLVVGLLVPMLGGSATARPPPRRICAVCVAAEQQGTVGGAPLVVRSSATTIRVDEDGDGHWTSTVRLNDAAAEELADDPALRRQFVADALDRYAAATNPRNVHSRVDGWTLVVEYTVPGMAHRTAGDVLLVDFFYDHGDPGRWYRLGADRVVLRGPQGTAVTWAPPGAAVESGRVVWRADSGDWTTVEGRGYVAFAPDDGPVATVATVAAVRTDVLRASAADLPAAATLPAALLALVVALLAFRGGWVRADSRRERVGRAVAVAGALALLSVVAPLVAGAIPDLVDAVFGWLFTLVLSGAAVLLPVGLLVVGVQYALLVGWRPREHGLSAPEEPSTDVTVRSALVAGGVALGGVGIVTGILAVLSGGVVGGLVSGLLYAGPVALFLPLGAAERVGHPGRHLLRAAIVAAPAGLALLMGPFGGLMTTFLPILLAPWAVVTAFVGLLAYPAGHRLGGGSRRDRVVSAAEGSVDGAE